MSTAIATPRWSTLPGKPAAFPELTAGNTLAAATANTAAINAMSLAVSTTGAGRGTLWVPDGDWYILLSLAATYLRARNNLTIRGQSWDSRLIVYSGSGNYLAVFWDAGSTLTNFTLRNLSILQNPQGNTSADIRTYNGTTVLNNNQCQFGLYVTGANCRNIRVIETNWEDCCGVNTLDVNSVGGARVRAFGNRLSFKRGHTTGVMPDSGPFGPNPGYDASMGYFACRDVKGGDNEFLVDDYADYNGGVEIHGVEQAWQGNRFEGVYTAFSVVPPFTAGENQDLSNVDVSGNHISRSAVAIKMQLPSSLVGARGWKIDRNIITLYQAGGHHDSRECGGIILSDNGPTGGTIDGLEITNNRVEFEPDTRATSTRYPRDGSPAALTIIAHGIQVSQQSPVVNLKIRHNTVVRAPALGITVGYYDAAATLTHVDIADNETIDAGSNPNNVLVNTNNQRAHIEVTGKLYDVKVHDNQIVDTAPGLTLNGMYGLRLAPHIGAGTPLFSFAHNNRIQTSVLSLFPYIADFGFTLFARNFGALATAGNLSHEQAPTLRCTPTANVTGILLTAGTYNGQRITVLNESLFTITFAATGTFGTPGASNVAAGTAEVIGAKQARTFYWSSAVNQWFAER